MSSNKKYYWLKLKENFFTDKTIKKLRKIAGGDTYTIIYLKLLLKATETDGKLYFDGVEDTFADEIALDIDEDSENVKVTLMYLIKNRLLVEISDYEMELTRINEMIGSETNKAELMRKKRARDKQLDGEIKALPPKSNAERQQSFRAKQFCEKQGHIPLVEDYNNKIRYGGNYYIVLKREKGKCAICNGNDTLCVHHIDGYDEKKPENNATNKMITLCRSCHIRVHRSGLEIPNEILESIDYFAENSNGNENVLPDVTQTLPYIEIEKDKEIDKEKEIEIEKREKKKTMDSKESTSSSSKQINEFIFLYHDICKSLPKIRILTDKRKKAIKALLSKISLEEIKEAFEIIERTPFLRGDNDRGWKPNIDFLVKHDNIVKILEGFYDSSSQSNVQPQKQERYNPDKVYEDNWDEWFQEVLGNEDGRHA